MYKISLLDKISIALVLIGALNWGLIGFAHLNLVQEITEVFGSAAVILQTIIYILVGVAAVNIILLIYRGRNPRTYSHE